MAGKHILISGIVYFENILQINVFTFFFFSPNRYANSGTGKFKSRSEKALGKRWIGDTNEKIAGLLAQHETLHV